VPSLHVADYVDELANDTTEISELTLDVNANTMARAIKLCRLLIPHAHEAYRLMSGKATKPKALTPQQKDANKILRWIQIGGLVRFTRTELFKENGFKNWDKERVDIALAVLVRHGHISSELEDRTTASAREHNRF